VALQISSRKDGDPHSAHTDFVDRNYCTRSCQKSVTTAPAEQTSRNTAR
jgi:hypothetical protein